MTTKRAIYISLGITALTAVVLALMGRVFVSETGRIMLWVGELNTAEGSQQIADWYTASHFIHGIIFFGFLYLFRKRLSLGARLIIATIVEVGWELLENSSFIIDRYRETTIAIGYMGDSILNSVSDILFMMLGFYVAQKIPWWLSVALVLTLELVVGYLIRDNLTLNIIMLVYPLEAIQTWQAG
jgi:hypothetical protein